MAILSFRDPETETLYLGTRAARWVNIERVALRKLTQLAISSRLENLRVPPGNRLETLSGDRQGQPSIHINDIVAGKRAVTAETDLLLCRYFGVSDGWWLLLQAHYDTHIARRELGKQLQKVHRYKLLSETVAL
ncbi:type II toxin-antitoxin system RelE/ParE family toxin [Ferrovum sp. PN-J185]|uniref:type II toxin-antitoxin system RelE/ParE family toxin n=1 Tax=Ferrovum sp. PN-J185 TaxID=1356306 RepID=UPI00079988C9|nr:type II toxin-antitoxin system RelE/ParE family toxin [Ferrovum sp. PN-J185]KXW56251.1 toxin HigB-1 [Ferrovum sp. PN-J185]MCC6068974.1 type II toxin-antitoxin system RelE/ParE family toxin [Ferrovum sp. PN-J185]MDE1891046.1 type II toxin-antitoxin system RelE/ParE family toxin [Betaproteobacteria bacterium]MDE2055642.1 type II toxin-antitoxin system RelE/ParE family toxin [Betaproteobacteria bacterium]